MKIILMSGIAGSGKSTFVKKNYPGAIVCSADSYFSRTGEYVFEPAYLGVAHGLCLRKYLDALIEDRSSNRVVVVDNTNLSAVELAPYVALAQAYGVECEIVTLVCTPFAGQRNVHGVPLEALHRMANVLAERKLPPFWDVKLTTI